MPYRIDRYWLFVLPLLLLTVFAYVGPVGWLLSLSVLSPSPGARNFERIIESSGIQSMLATTGRVVAVTSVLSLLIGYLIAYAMLQVGRGQRLALSLCVLVPFWLSVLVRAFAWLILLRNNGLLNQGLIGAGVIDRPLELVRNELGVVIGMVHYLTPYAVFPLYAAMKSVDRRLLMASQSLGAGPMRTFLRVFLPQTAPALLGAGLLVFVFGLGFYVTPAILGGGRVVMLSEYVSVMILQTLRWGLAGALCLLLLLATGALIWMTSRVIDLRRVLGAA